MKKLLSTLLLLPAACLASGLYGIVGAGQTANKLNGNGVWYQEGFNHSLKATSTAYQIGAGFHVTEWLAVEALYHDFGEAHISADFVFPDANYNLSTNKCNGRCNPLAHGEGTGSATGFSLSVLPTYHINSSWSAYARIGALWYRRTWDERVSCCAPGTYRDGDIYGQRLHETFASLRDVGGNQYQWTGDGGDVMPNSHGVASIYGIGIVYKIVSIEYSTTRGIKALGSGYTEVSTISVNLKFDF